MIFDFSKFKFDKNSRIELPTIILCTPNKVKLGALGILSSLPKVDLSLNNMSRVQLSIPAYTFDSDTGSYMPTPFYGDVLGKMLLLIEPYGYFRILNPRIESDGYKEIKDIDAFSLEDELNDAKLSAWEGTFPLYNLTDPQDPDSILGLVTQLKPSWKIGHVSPKLLGHWRTFSVTDRTLYSFLKEDIQKSFQCLFIFNSYERSINAYTLDELAESSIISMSHDNMIKTLKTEFLDDDIVTKLEVYGAGDLDIREMNPNGMAALYNFNYFMNEKWLPEDKGLIQAWENYETLWNSRLPYYSDLMVLYRIYTSNLINADIKLTLLENTLSGLRTRQKDYASYSTNSALKSIYDDIQRQISDIEPQIANQKQVVAQATAEFNDTTVKIKVVNDELAFSANFTTEQLILLDSITFMDTLTCESFVDSDIDYGSPVITANNLSSCTLIVNSGSINRVINSVTNATTYQFTNNKVTFSYVGQILNTNNVLENVNCYVDVDVSNGTAYSMSNGDYVCSLEVTVGIIKVGSTEYSIRNGIITISAKQNSVSYTQNSRLQIIGGAGNIYATESSSSLSRQRIIRELYEYSLEIFEKISIPSFQFEIDSINPFFLEEFQPVLQNFKLGNTVTVDIGNKWVKPMLLDVELDYNAENQITMKFSNKLRFGSNVFDNAELFEESINRSKSATAHQYDYMAFKGSNADNVIFNYINSALDMSKQMLMNSDKQEMIQGGFGTIYRKANPDGTFDPRQAWWTNNQLAFSDNHWESVKMAIGEITFNQQNLYGLVNSKICLRSIATELILC